MTIAQRHQAHWQTGCSCLGETDICCQSGCPCHAEEPTEAERECLCTHLDVGFHAPDCPVHRPPLPWPLTLPGNASMDDRWAASPEGKAAVAHADSILCDTSLGSGRGRAAIDAYMDARDAWTAEHAGEGT